MIEKFSGNEVCHVKQISYGIISYKCGNKAVYNIGNGKLRCLAHTIKWARKQYMKELTNIVSFPK